MVVSGFVGQATCDWELVLVSRAFSGGFDCVLGALGFLLPPTPFVGCRFFFVVEPRVGMGVLVMLGFLGAFAVRVVGPGALFFTVGILPCRFRFIPTLKNVYEQRHCFV